MTCQDVADFLVDYVDGELPALVRQQFEAHLGVCPACVNYLQQYRDTIRLVAGVSDDMLAEMPEELVRAIVLSARR